MRRTKTSTISELGLKVSELGLKVSDNDPLCEQNTETNAATLCADIKKAETRETEWVWQNILVFMYIHGAALYGAYLMSVSSKWQTNVFAAILLQVTGLGITAAAHRLWTHRSYKAKWPLRFIYIIFNTIAFQNSVYIWARDHRVHHKYSETDADPHNATRGFFFAHIGWLMCKKHPEVMEKGKTIDLSDLRADSLLMFQHKYYLILMPLACFIVPTLIPMYFWNESISNAWHVPVILRWVLSLNFTWLINSACHLWGSKPYDKNLNPAENKVICILALGEGWHNFHHVFPWDYKTGEYVTYSTNLTCIFVNWCAKMGWAYDLKTVSNDMIKKRVQRTGDGSHAVWGWGDDDLSKDEINNAVNEQNM